MKSDREWGDEVADAFKGMTAEARHAIAVRAAHVVRQVRREMDEQAAEAVEAFLRLTDDAARRRQMFESRKEMTKQRRTPQ